MSDDGNRAFLADHAGTITIVETESRVLGSDDLSAVKTTTIQLDGNPTDIAVDMSGYRAYVSNSNGTVSVIEHTSGGQWTVRPAVELGGNPHSVAVSAFGQAIVTNSSNGLVSLIDTDGSVTSVNVGSKTRSVAINDNGTRAIAYISGGGVFIIDTTTGRFERIDGIYSYRDDGFIAISGNGERAFVTDHDASVTVIDISIAQDEWLVQSTRDVSLIDGVDDYDDYVHSVASTPNGSRAFIVTHANVYAVTPKGSFFDINREAIDVNNNASDFQQVAVSIDGNVVIATDISGKLTVINGRAF